jgi:hypothetical protein
MAASAAASPSVSAQEPPKDSGTAALQIMLELASDFTTAEPSVRAETLGLIDKEDDLSGKEIALGNAVLAGTPDSHYRTLVPAQADQAFAYLDALHTSYARFKGAQTAGDREWIAKQFKASQEYAALSKNALIIEAQVNERNADRLRASSFAVRRSPEQQVAFAEKVKTNGLSSEHRKLLLDGGDGDEEIKLFQQELLNTKPDQLGVSAVEWLSQIAAMRRALASALNTFAQASPGGFLGTSSQTFVVGNPHDKEETIDLFIRPISIPPDWKLSVVDVEEQAKVKVREIEPGRHYAVSLPAKVELNVASVVVPVGDVGTNTTARWAVEGRIGDELIGGMVHEMNVPYVIADLKLPPVGSKEVEEELLPTPSKAWARIVMEVAAGIIAMGMLVFIFIFWHRRRPKVTP